MEINQINHISGMVSGLNISIIYRNCFWLCADPYYTGYRVVYKTYEGTNDNPVYDQTEKVVEKRMRFRVAFCVA